MPAVPYLPSKESGFRGHSVRGPESSRRARALPLWATVAAYGRDGLRALVERLEGVAAHFLDLVESHPNLESTSEFSIGIACFRWVDVGRSVEDLNAFNRRLIDAINEDGTFIVGATVLDGLVVLRTSLLNWQLQVHHMDEFVSTIGTVAQRLAAQSSE